MAVSYIEIDTSQLNRDIQELEAGTEKARLALEEMLTELEELNSMWKGAANEAFRSQVRQDQSFMLDVLERLERLGECMTYASKEYVRCEGEVQDIVNSIQI